jgi:hypothetical protein
MALAIEKKVPLCFILPLLIPIIPEDDLPRIAKSRKMTYRGLANSGSRQAGIGQASVIFRGQVIPACHKPEFLKLTFRGQKNHGQLLKERKKVRKNIYSFLNHKVFHNFFNDVSITLNYITPA